MTRLEPECPTKLDCDQVAVRDESQVGAWDELLPASVPHEKEIVSRVYRSAKASITPDVVGVGVVLDKACQYQVRIPRVCPLELP